MAEAKKPKLQFNPALSSVFEDIAIAQSNDDFLSEFQSPEDKQMFANYSFGKTIEGMLGTSPFEEISPYKAVFNKDSKPLEVVDTDPPEVQAFKEIHNRLVRFGGKLPEPGFFQRTFANSMTNGWATLITGEDLSKTLGEFKVLEDGVKYKGEKLNLDQDELDLVTKFINRNTGGDIDRDFFDSFGETFVSLTMDLPLLALTGMVAGGAMRVTDATRALMQSNSLLSKTLGQVIQQTANFNILGLPQTVESVQENNIQGAIENIWHNTQMGVLAASTAGLGGALGRTTSVVPGIKEILRRSPALKEELSALAGSFGFGYLSTKFAGLEDEEALATALAFVGTHITNPRAYGRVLTEMKNRNVRVAIDAVDPKTGKPISFIPGYYIEKDGELRRIDTDAFKKDGRIVELDREPIKLTEKNKEQFVYINEIPDLVHSTFLDELNKIRANRTATKLMDSWKEKLDEKYIRQNSAELRQIADFVSVAVTNQKISDAFRRYRFPSTKEFDDLRFKISDEHNISYKDMTDFLISNIPDYVRDKDGFSKRLASFLGLKTDEAGKPIAETPEQDKIFSDLQKVVKTGADEFVKQVQDEQFQARSLRDFRNSKTEDEYVRKRMKEEIAQGLDTNEAIGRMVELRKEYRDKLFNYIKEYGKSVAEKIPEETQERLKELGYTEEQIGRLEKGEVEKIISEGERKTVEEEIRQKPIPELTEKEATQRLEAIDREIAEKIPDERLQAEVKVMTGTRKELPEDVQQLLRERDAVNARKHDLRAERERKEGRQEPIDITSVATPENRRKLLVYTPEERERSEAEEMRPEREAEVKRIQRDFQSSIKYVNDKKLKNKFEYIAEKMDIDPDLSWLWQTMDQLGVKVKYLYNSGTTWAARYLESSNTIEFNGASLGLGKKERINRAYSGMSPKEILQEDMVHEAIHVLQLDKRLGEDFYRKEISPLMKEIADAVTRIFAEDVEVMQQQYAEAGERTIPVSQAFQKLRRALQPYPYAFDEGRTFTELTTIALTHPGVAQYLDMIPATRPIKGGVKTIWDAIKQVIRKMYKQVLGLPEGSILDQLTQQLDNIYAKRGIVRLDRPGLAERVLEKPAGRSETPDRPFEQTRVQIESEQPEIIAQKNRKQPERIKRNGVIDIYTPQYKNALKRKYGENFAQEIEELDKRIPLEKNINEPSYKYQNTVSADDIESFASVMARMQERDSRDTKRSGLADFTVDKKTIDKLSKNYKIISLKALLAEYADLNLPPIFKAEISKAFRERAYIPGEAMIRGIPYEVNRILLNRNGWNAGSKWRKLAGIKTFGKQEITEDGKQLLQAIEAYELARYQGTISKDMSWGEFADWAGLNKNQREVLNAMRDAQREAIERMKEMKIKFIVDHDRSITTAMDEKTFRKFFKDRSKKDLTEINEMVNADPKLKEAIARYIVDEKYADWGRRFHYNGIRPANPETIIVDASRGEKDRLYTYFETREEADRWIQARKAEGYTINENYRIKDLIQRGDHFNKLTAHQLMELANAGHIPLDDKVIQKLLEATKKGVDLHTINKEYIPGMKYTPVEFETQLERFVREAIYGSYKPYYLTTIQRNLLEWESQLTPLIKSGRFPERVKKARAEYDYAQKYLNQLRQPERTFIDELRGATIAFQVGGIKPSFLFQQSMQGFQTTLAQAIADIKAAGGTTGDAIKMFGNATVNAVKAQMELRARKLGLKTRNNEIDSEILDHLERLELMNKITATGISELTAEGSELDFHYQRGAKKYLETVKRTMTILGKGVEKWTRTQSALTFYELGKRKGLTGDKLTQYMADGIDKTMAEWGKGGRAPLLDPKTASPTNSALVNAMKKSFMTYKTFSFYNYGMWRQFWAKRQYAALWTKFVVGTGMHGLTKFPLMASLLWIANMFTDEEDLDYTFWKLADELDEIVPEAGGILHRGFGSLLGLDLRETFGEDTPIATDLWAESWANSWESKVMDITLGAPLGFSQDIVRGVDQAREIIWNEIKGGTITTDKDLEKAEKIFMNMTPVFIRNIANAFTYEKDGIEVRGKRMVFADDLSALDVALKFLSFPIEKQTRAYKEYEYGIEAEYNKAQQILRKAKEHRKDLIKQGLSQEEINREMKRIVEYMNEARETIRRLKPEINKLKRQRKLTELENQ